MSRAGLDALLADADVLQRWLSVTCATDAAAVVAGLAQSVRDLRNERDKALARVGELVLQAEREEKTT